jgi:hypothetical protein
MPFNGSGTFVRLHNWTQDAANGIDINAGEADGEDNGFAAGLSLCATIDGQNKMAADFVPSAAGLYNLGTTGTPWLNIAAKSGTIGPPASGVAWTVNSFGANAAINFNSAAVTQIFTTYSIAGAIKAYNGAVGTAGDLVADSLAGDFIVRTSTTSIRTTVNGGASSATQIDTAGNLNLCNGTGAIVGPVYAGIPQTTTAISYTTILGDANRHIRMTGTTAAQTVTVPAGGAVAYPIGTAITFCNRSTQAWSLAFGDTVIWAANGTTGTRTLASNGMATAIKTDSNVWMISGSQLS